MKPHWPYIAPAPYHAMFTPQQCLPVQRHADGRGPGAHPIYRAWREEAGNFRRDETIATIRPTYQGLIAQVDAHLGRVWAELERLRRWRDTLVIFTADHGDYLGDHWLGEKELFHDCVQRVPFLVHDPTAAADATRGTEDPRPVEALDCVPTILEAVGADPAAHVVEGRSLLPVLRGVATRSKRAPGVAREPAGPDLEWRDAAFSELGWTFRGARRRLGEPTGQHMAWMVRTARWKYIQWTGGDRPQLFDLHGDPQELFSILAPMAPWRGCGTPCATGR